MTIYINPTGKKKLSEPRIDTASTSVKKTAVHREKMKEKEVNIHIRNVTRKNTLEPSNVRFSPKIKYVCFPKDFPKRLAKGSASASTIMDV